MPRRNRREVSAASAGDEDGELFLGDLQQRVLGPGAARLDGFEVRSSLNKLKRYKCPYCAGWVEPGTAHMVAVPVAAPEARRHYHSGCWTRHVRGQGPLAQGRLR